MIVYQLYNSTRTPYIKHCLGIMLYKTLVKRLLHEHIRHTVYHTLNSVPEKRDKWNDSADEQISIFTI